MDNIRWLDPVIEQSLHMRFCIKIFLVLFSSYLYAQQPERSSNPSSLDPGSTEKVFAPFRSSKSAIKNVRGSHIETQKEYVARMKRTVKMIRKEERLMKKPQYANPLYFGHKRLPKKHKASKMKFCKECGIRH
jgi:hypothetical protein